MTDKFKTRLMYVILGVIAVVIFLLLQQGVTTLWGTILSIVFSIIFTYVIFIFTLLIILGISLIRGREKW